MREIKFRMWDDKYKVMVDDTYEMFWYYTDGCGHSIAETIGFYETQKVNKRKRFHLMQFTGIKDYDGKDIYEGDILENNITRRVVIWANDGWFVIDIEEYLQDSRESIDTWPECQDRLGIRPLGRVAGNVYENPELLEGEKG